MLARMLESGPQVRLVQLQGQRNRLVPSSHYFIHHTFSASDRFYDSHFSWSDNLLSWTRQQAIIANSKETKGFGKTEKSVHHFLISINLKFSFMSLFIRIANEQHDLTASLASFVFFVKMRDGCVFDVELGLDFGDDRISGKKASRL